MANKMTSTLRAVGSEMELQKMRQDLGNLDSDTITTLIDHPLTEPSIDDEGNWVFGEPHTETIRLAKTLSNQYPLMIWEVGITDGDVTMTAQVSGGTGSQQRRTVNADGTESVLTYTIQPKSTVLTGVIVIEDDKTTDITDTYLTHSKNIATYTDLSPENISQSTSNDLR